MAARGWHGSRWSWTEGHNTKAWCRRQRFVDDAQSTRNMATGLPGAEGGVDAKTSGWEVVWWLKSPVALGGHWWGGGGDNSLGKRLAVRDKNRKYSAWHICSTRGGVERVALLGACCLFYPTRPKPMIFFSCGCIFGHPLDMLWVHHPCLAVQLPPDWVLLPSSQFSSTVRTTCSYVCMSSLMSETHLLLYLYQLLQLYAICYFYVVVIGTDSPNSLRRKVREKYIKQSYSILSSSA
jgi:hypothetical protein